VKRLRRSSMSDGVLASVVAGVVVGFVQWLLTHDVVRPSREWIAPAVGAALVFMISVCLIFVWRPQIYRFVPYMSREALSARIVKAEHAIWSFQISGGGFTTASVDRYRQWLQGDQRRQLRMLFANPDNDGLLRSIIQLDGLARRTTIDAEVDHLRATILETLRKYLTLESQYSRQIEVRVYDCAPPCSIHAVDPDTAASATSIFVENYLPDLPREERPCLMVRRHQVLYDMYLRQSAAWFEQGHRYQLNVDTSDSGTRDELSEVVVPEE
jgi:hypothetical protein